MTDWVCFRNYFPEWEAVYVTHGWVARVLVIPGSYETLITIYSLRTCYFYLKRNLHMIHYKPKASACNES